MEKQRLQRKDFGLLVPHSKGYVIADQAEAAPFKPPSAATIKIWRE